MEITHASPIKAAVLGAAGRMGQCIIESIAAAKGIALTAAVERPGHPLLGSRIVAKGDGQGKEIIITDDAQRVFSAIDVVIDFTSVESSLSYAPLIAAAGKAAVIGTTGFSSAQSEELREHLRGARWVFAPNMSIGVNLMFKLAGLAARILSQDFDVEIIEAHHRMKQDAPSGTALRLAHIIAESLGRDLDDAGVYGRKGLVGARTLQEIGIHAIRGGDIVGDHTVLFAGPGERFEIIHRAHSRDTFARGAVKAATWVVHQPPSMYTMQDVLGI